MTENKLISIVGAGHSGSTLLDLMLGRNSNICSTGEIVRWDEYLNEQKECSCGVVPDACEFWSKIVKDWNVYTTSIANAATDTRTNSLEGTGQRLRHKLSIGITALLPIHTFPTLIERMEPSYQKRIDNNIVLFRMIYERSGKTILCDSSKSVYRFRRFHIRYPNTSKAIFLSRDGRAVVASNMKRFDKSVVDCTKAWHFTNMYTKRLLNTLPNKSFIHVRYEEICRDPESTLKRICEFIECEYEVEMLNIFGSIQHNIGGNRMRMTNDKQTSIKEDLKWRNLLSEDELSIFNKIGGKTNRYLLGDFYYP